MDPLSAITAALIAGATAAASDTASLAVKEAYQGLKKLLVDGYKIVSTDLLEKKPTSPTYQKAVEDELRENATVANDIAVIEKTKTMRDTLLAEPANRLASWGIDIKELESGGNIIAQRISGGIVGDKWKAAKDIHISDVTGSGIAPEKR